MEHKDGLKPTCREVHRLVSEGMDRDLSVVEQIRMRLHLVVCGACTRFNGQMWLLRRAMHTFPTDQPAPPRHEPGKDTDPR
ncbi:zf-HC2 domain-containing protein [Janthinobacterium agaricidamnosum]|uniref:Uncharacterized domain protein n=1 Tax=Janthinobacterium agaricidamnosum NBRC 102515 = DSM 9628 TaxID=1349767 RepID=W0VD45_9BURK|nr:zf-HC2 domain-containing protein [Janthinobacterium agaricidamnosum]CDG85831.1 putative uncharacterized domain protein [Janthinobacterium agaricidamnosum NBRC 102515 = DSM 9628]